MTLMNKEHKMNLDIEFEFANGTHNDILPKTKKQIGNQLDNLICDKHRLPPHLTIANIKSGSQNKDIIEFRLGCCCKNLPKK